MFIRSSFCIACASKRGARPYKDVLYSDRLPAVRCLYMGNVKKSKKFLYFGRNFLPPIFGKIFDVFVKVRTFICDKKCSCFSQYVYFCVFYASCFACLRFLAQGAERWSKAGRCTDPQGAAVPLDPQGAGALEQARKRKTQNKHSQTTGKQTTEKKETI